MVDSIEGNADLFYSPWEIPPFIPYKKQRELPGFLGPCHTVDFLSARFVPRQNLFKL